MQRKVICLIMVAICVVALFPTPTLASSGIRFGISSYVPIAITVLSFVGNSLIINGSLNVTGNISGNFYHAGMWYNNRTGISATFNNTYQTFTFFDYPPSGHEHTVGFTYLGKGIMRCDVSGEYDITWHAEGVGTNNHNYEGVIFVNNIMYNRTAGPAIGMQSNEVSMSGIGFLDLKKNDNITLRIADLSGTSVGSARLGNVHIVWVGN